MKIGIIGGGASGLVAAISAARCGATVTILESGERVGRKILSTGNGKCNFTNSNMASTHFRSNTICDVSAYLNEFGTKETLAFFDSLHMLYHDRNGYYYPISGQASTVLDSLRFEIERNSDSIRVYTNQKTSDITYMGDKGVKVITSNKEYIFDKIILACGSKAAPKLGSDGSGYQLIKKLDKNIQIEPVVPALVQLKCKETYLKAVAGVRTEALVKVYIDSKETASDRGELQLTDYGVSGIPIFQISRYAAYGCLNKKNVTVHINVVPQFTDVEFRDMMHERKGSLANESIETFCAGLIDKLFY